MSDVTPYDLLQPRSDFALRNRYLSRIGAKVTEQFHYLRYYVLFFAGGNCVAFVIVTLQFVFVFRFRSILFLKQVWFTVLSDNGIPNCNTTRLAHIFLL